MSTNSDLRVAHTFFYFSTDTDELRINYPEMMNKTNGIDAVSHNGWTFEWEIKNFSIIQCKEVGEYVLSPIFMTTWLRNLVKWRLQLYPKGDSSVSDGHLSLFIECLTTGKITADITFWILNEENRKRWCWNMGNMTFNRQTNSSWGKPSFIQRHLIMDLNNRVLVNNTLKIGCEIIFNQKYNDNIHAKHLDVNSLEYRLEALADFENLLDTGNGSDVTLRVDGIEIKAHKAFLISRSPVFQAMFEHDMREKGENVVDILDLKYNIVKELLRFIYAGKVNNIQNRASELLEASEKYCIRGLKTLCEHELSRQIKLKNVFRLIEVAEKYNADFLKSQAIAFITTNKHQMADRPELKKLADLQADTICDVFKAVLKNN